MRARIVGSGALLAIVTAVLSCNAILGIHAFDAGPAGGGADTGNFETNFAFDGGPESGGEGGGGDSGSDVLGPPNTDAEIAAAQSFPNTVIEAYCTKLQSCCAGKFSVAVCQKDLGNVVGITYLGLVLNGIESRHYAYDSAKAAFCLSDIKGLACGSNMAAAITTLTEDCSSAYVGLLGEGAKGCESSFDCKPGLYCAPLTAAGDTVGSSGTCTGLAEAGAPCVDTTYSSDCTYVGLGSAGGSTKLYCRPNVVSGGLGDGGLCTFEQVRGSNCYYPGTPQQCATQLCVAVDMSVADGGFACEEQGMLTNVNGVDLCMAYVVADGG